MGIFEILNFLVVLTQTTVNVGQISIPTGETPKSPEVRYECVKQIHDDQKPAEIAFDQEQDQEDQEKEN